MIGSDTLNGLVPSSGSPGSFRPDDGTRSLPGASGFSPADLLIPGVSFLNNLIGGASSAAAQDRANQMNQSIAREQMGFQREMSSTAYQRAMADAKAAGLNPALIYSQGGASTPSGASSTAEPVDYAQGLAGGIEKAIGVAQAQKALKLADEQIKSARASTAKTRAETRKVDQNWDLDSKYQPISAAIGDFSKQLMGFLNPGKGKEPPTIFKPEERAQMIKAVQSKELSSAMQKALDFKKKSSADALKFSKPPGLGKAIKDY